MILRNHLAVTWITFRKIWPGPWGLIRRTCLSPGSSTIGSDLILTPWSYCFDSAFISELMLYFILRVLSIPSDPFQELQMIKQNDTESGQKMIIMAYSCFCSWHYGCFKVLWKLAKLGMIYCWSIFCFDKKIWGIHCFHFRGISHIVLVSNITWSLSRSSWSSWKV